MDKLFDDTLFVSKERPVKITDQQETQMFIDLAKDVIKYGYSDSDEETIAEDLKNLSFCSSGFERAKDLDSNGNASYEIDGEFVDWLDDIEYARSVILAANVQLWVTAHNPQPKFKEGTKLKVITTLNREKLAGSIIYVTAVRPLVAEYLVDENETRPGGTVMSYERVELNCEVSE